MNNHFDSTQFCSEFIVGRNEEINPQKSFTSLKRFIIEHVAIIRCVLTTEILVLPLNLYQDVKGYLHIISK